MLEEVGGGISLLKEDQRQKHIQFLDVVFGACVAILYQPENKPPFTAAEQRL